MSYTRHFTVADEFIGHADSVISGIEDDFIKSRYIGFVSVAAVTAYELAFKEIIFGFCDKKHKILGSFSRDAYARLNGQIKLDQVKGTHVKRFGQIYSNRFKKKIEEAELAELRNSGRSIKSSYDNVIVWRHKFAHTGDIPQGPTYDEAKQSYYAGKAVLECLAATMTR